MALNTWWTGDDTANDSSGNGHHLTITSADYQTGKKNNCFYCPADANKNGEVATYETMGGTRTLLSVFAWIKSNDNTTTTSLVIASKYDTNNQRQWRMDINAGGIADGFLRILLSSNGTGAQKDYRYTQDLTDNTWKHVGFTYEGTGTGVLKLYVNGAEVAAAKITDTAITTLHNSTAKIGMGCGFASGSKLATTYFNGYIDEVRIYDDVLSDADILALYNSYFAPRFQINIGDSWKTVAGVQINIGDTWKAVPSAQINIGDAWKTI